MPRHAPVNYPQVHRPTAQPDLGLLPPQNTFDEAQNRFSWQVAAGDERLEARENMVSRMPPLPVLPGHLDEPVLPSQKCGQFQQKSQFRPDVPRNLQQIPVPLDQTPSYEDSQAAYRESKMQEQPMYTADLGEQALSAHAFPMRPVEEQPQDSQELKPEQHQPIQIGPDANPLSPASPRSPGTTNIRTFPPPRPSDMHFEQPLSSTQAYHSSRGGTWQHGLFSCADPTTCLSSMFCPCVVYGRTQHKLSRKSDHKDPTNMLGFSAVNKSCVAWSLLCGVNILLTSIQRTRVRKAYEMEEGAGSVIGDCMRSCVCCCCVIAQDEKETKAREKGGSTEGYQRTEGMRWPATD